MLSNRSVERTFDPAAGLLPQAAVRVKRRSPLTLDAYDMPVKLYDELYHFTHITNLRGIREHGLLSQRAMALRGLRAVDISDPDVQRWRDRPEPIFGCPIHEYVPLYFNPKNAMLYKRRELRMELVILAVPLVKAQEHVYIFTDGNAASGSTVFSLDMETSKTSDAVLKAGYWSELPDGKRRRCAEVLVHEQVPMADITHAYCRCTATCAAAQAILDCPVTIDASMFY